MLKRHRNQVHELVQKASLAPTEFDSVHDPKDGHFTLTFKSQPQLWFRFVPSDEGAHAAYYYRWYYSAYIAPGFREIDYHGDLPHRNPSPFHEALADFDDWLRTSVSDCLDDRGGADLWQALQSSPMATDTLGDEDAFSDHEIARIDSSLGRLLEEVRVAKLLTHDQLESLNERVDYLARASRRMGKKDWAALFTGILVTFAINAALTAPVAGDLLRMAGACDSLAVLRTNTATLVDRARALGE